MALKDRLYDKPVIGTALRVQDRYKADAGDQFAAAIGFFGFLSLFPIIILALAITGFVLAGRPATDARVVADAITSAIPGFTAALGGDCAAGDAECTTAIARALDRIVENRGSIGLIGLASLLFTGLRVTNAAQTATLVIFESNLLSVPGWKLRLRQLISLVVLGVLALLGAASSSAVGFVSSLDPTGAASFLRPLTGAAVTLVADFVLFLTAYNLFLMEQRPPWRKLVPGAILAAIGWAALKIVGSTYVGRQVSSASELYGTLGGVIGLLLLFYLAGRLFVYGAELSAERLAQQGWEPLASEVVRPEHVDVEAPQPAGSADEETTGENGRSRSASVPAARIRRPPPSYVVRGEPAPQMRAVAQRPAAPPDGGPRQATAFAIAIGAVGGLVAALKPWRRD